MPTFLGQNFLTDNSIAKRIAESANLSTTDNVLEIGPGKGILTKYLAERAGRVLAVEIDRNLVKSLDSRFRGNDKGGVKVIEDDVLKINLPKLIEEYDFENYKVVANLPYYITSKTIRLLLETKYPPREMILMIQKEVGERICAPDGKESILSISVKFYAEPKMLFEVSRENFQPVPEVDSAVIRIKRKKEIPDVYPVKFPTHGRGAPMAQFNRAGFFSLVRAGFSSKRKQLLNNLSNGFHMPKEKTAEIIKKAGIKPTQRAQELTLEDWLLLHKEISNLTTGQKTR